MNSFRIEKEKKRCKVCRANALIEFISFGQMPVTGAYLKKEDLDKPEYTYNMTVGFCENCKMVQLIEVVPYEKYIISDGKGKTNYAFYSSTSEFMQQHFAELAKEVEERFLDSINPRVVEIGSNDGIMLKVFKERSNVIGIEPSTNVAEVAQKQGIKTITEFFTEALARKLVDEKEKFRVVLSTNVTLNIIDINDFMRGVKTLLDDKGVFITEDPHILGILEKNSYDQIYEEHIWYFSLTSLSNLYEMHSMEIFDAEKQWVHGGSMRVYACKKGAYEKTDRLKRYLKIEEEMKIGSLEIYSQFANNVEENKQKLISLLKDLKAQGKKIVGYAASCKSSTVMNYCGIGTKILDYISDSTPFKQGLYTPGKHIPILSPDVFHNDKDIDYAFLFIWNHAKEVIEKEQEFLRRGGKFITHLPTARIISPEEFISDEEKKIEIKNLKVFHEGAEGHLFETLRSDDGIFDGVFGQNFVSFVNPGIIKGFHRHKSLTEYTTCIKGNILYVLVKEVIGGQPIIKKIKMGEDNMIMIKTPPGFWHGYVPLGNQEAVVLYTMDKPYDPNNIDQEDKDPHAFGDIWKLD